LKRAGRYENVLAYIIANVVSMKSESTYGLDYKEFLDRELKEQTSISANKFEYLRSRP
jgi:hypothetical protein